MNIFEKYSNYYDLLYKDKDYKGEADYINKLIKKYKSSSIDVLDLGCGTGRHDYLLSNIGYSVSGIDISSSMIQIARNKEKEGLKFYCDNICTANLNKTFDVVLSLFHVISYLSSNEELIGAFRTASNHLKKDGIFIFDCWYGPAVLTERPQIRIKRIEDESISVCRIAEPIMHTTENIVDVNYNIFVRHKKTGEIEEIKEVHSMRYLFHPEISHLLYEAGFSLMDSFEFMTDKEPSFNTWGVCFIAKKTL